MRETPHDEASTLYVVRMKRFLGHGVYNPAGGLTYHLRALRYRNLWQPFRSELSRWFASWEPPERHLVLVGPSAGYTLPFVQLARYERLTVFEPDPIACWLFARRLRTHFAERAPRVTFVHEDCLLERPERLLDFVAEQKAAVLFCNVLGQLVYLLPEVGREERLSEIKAQIALRTQQTNGPSWASYHDRVSGPIAPVFASYTSQTRWSDEQLIESAYDAKGQTRAIELHDHHSHGFFPEAIPHTYLSWQIERGTFHLIEAVQLTRRG